MTFKPTPLACPHCGHGYDRHVALGPVPSVPHDGAWSLCIACGQWAVFDGGGLRRLTADETAEIRLNEDATRAHAAWILMRMGIALRKPDD